MSRPEIHPFKMNLRNRTLLVFVLAWLALGLGAWLRWHASDPAFLQRADFDGGSFIGSDERLAATNEIARVFLWSGASLLTLAAGAWLFVPVWRAAAPREPLLAGAPVSPASVR